MNTATETEYRQLPLYAHQLLAGVPLKTLSKLELPGGCSGLTVLQIKDLIGFNTQDLDVGPLTRSLFWLRTFVGNVFGWDRPNKSAVSETSFIRRLTKSDRERSLVPTGTEEGISRILYCFENEFTAEIINKTVHCFWVMATEPAPDGYKLFMAVYVRKLNWFTPIYMALVGPMLRWIIYPAMNRSVKRNWLKSNGPAHPFEITAAR